MPLNISHLATPLVSFWIALIAAGLAAIPVYRALLALKSRQTVSQYAPEGHQKKQGTPTMGGLITLVGFVAAMAPLVVDYVRTHGYALLIVRSPPGAFLVLFLGFALIGFVDDYVVPRRFTGKRGLGWRQKILMQLAVAALAAYLLLGTRPLWELGLLVFIILFFSNAYNFADGLDGLAGSLLLAMTPGLLAVILLPSWGFLSSVVLALVGGILPFLLLNAPPARVFMGDVGSLPIGASLGMVFGVLTVYTLSPNLILGWLGPYLGRGSDMGGAVLPALLLLSLVMVAELVPVPLQILSVKLRKKKLFPMTPIHHAFEAAGWPESKVVWTFAVVQLILSLGAATVFVANAPAQGLR